MASAWRKLIPAALRLRLKKLLYSGSQRHCLLCGSSCRTFRPFGRPTRPQALCPICGSLERHRIVWAYFERCTDLFDGRKKDMLHVAPEKCLEAKLRPRLTGGYLTGDLLNPRAMVQMDIMDIDFPAESFDVVYCSHVLEHVDDDRRAMSEFRRVLKKDGWALLLVPITAEATYEDPLVTDPQERLRLFGQEDHVRCYGPDFADRVAAAGFEVKAIAPKEFLNREEAEKMVLDDTILFRCSKTPAIN